MTPLDRWEDAGGLSPSTLAAAVAALVAAAEFAHAAGEHLAAAHFLHVADYWADRVEAWCYSPGRGHYVRLGTDPENGPGPEAVLSNDFLELVRLGIRSPEHPAVRASLVKVDATPALGRARRAHLAALRRRHLRRASRRLALGGRAPASGGPGRCSPASAPSTNSWPAAPASPTWRGPTSPSPGPA